MSFELIDNLIQVTVMAAAALAAGIAALRHGSRILVMLSFGYACLGMGTLYYLLSLAITGDAPQVFYVSEISWIASYTFFLSVQIAGSEGRHVRFRALPAAGAAVTAAVVLIDRMMGPSFFVSGAFAVVLASIIYLSVFRLLDGGERHMADLWFVICIFLQLMVYLTSAFMTDYLHFNLYFAVDLANTFCLAALLPIEIKELRAEKAAEEKQVFRRPPERRNGE